MLQRGATDKKAFVHYQEFAATATTHGRRTATVNRDNRHHYGYDATANKVSPFDNIALTPLLRTANEPLGPIEPNDSADYHVALRR